MSGICDTCKRDTCRVRTDGLETCGFHEGESRYERLFGTPEKMARFIVDSCSCDCVGCVMPTDCPCYDSFECMKEDYDAILEWLRGDA